MCHTYTALQVYRQTREQGDPHSHASTYAFTHSHASTHAFTHSHACRATTTRPSTAMHVFQDVVREFGLKHVFSKTYSSTSQGKVERAQLTLRSMVGKWKTASGRNDWHPRIYTLSREHPRIYLHTLTRAPTHLPTRAHAHVRALKRTSSPLGQASLQPGVSSVITLLLGLYL